MHTHEFLNSTSPPCNWNTVDMHKQEEELNAGHEHDKANILALNTKLKELEKELHSRPPITFEGLLEKIG